MTDVGGCTFNFLFRDPDGGRYMGTAGHCVRMGAVWPRERVWPPGSGPVGRDGDGKRIGEFAYGVVVSDGDQGQAKDFALIRLDSGVDASPEMCHFGAPRGIYTSNTANPAVLEYYGNGVGITNVAPARSAVATGTPNPDHLYAFGLALPGDSGSGVMTADGLAVGVLVTTGLHGVGFVEGPNGTPAPHFPVSGNGVDVGTMGITRLGPQVARASEMLHTPLQMVTTR